MISTPLTVVLVAAAIGLGALMVLGLGYVARLERRPSILLVGGAIIVGWVVMAITLAGEGFWETTSATPLIPPPRIAFAIVLPTILGSLLVRSTTIRGWVKRIPLHVLVGVQLYRVAGVLFLIAYAQNAMPAEFALPAGIGDIIVGVTAVIVAVLVLRQGEQRARPMVLAWCALGILDLVVAVGAGFLSAPSAFQQLALNGPNAAIVSYPFVLIPTFAVPLSIILHIYAISRVWVAPAHRTGWSPQREPGTA